MIFLISDSEGNAVHEIRRDIKMFDRRVLKERGKASFKANYWRCVLVALILALTAGGTGTSGPSTVRQMRQSGGTQDIINEYNNLIPDADDDYGDSIGDMWNIDDFEDLENPEDLDSIEDLEEFYNIEDPATGGSPLNGLIATGIFGLIVVIVLAAIVIGALIGIFLLNPLAVGCRKYFLNNSYAAADVGLVGHAFQTDYRNVVKVTFFRDLYIFLWSLLLIVPGIIKSYEYRMVAYLLAENPSMDTKEALETSKNMMYGNKWDAFILDFSFLGWSILASVTLGLLGIFYVDPYIAATDAELYKALSGKTSGFDEYSEEEGAFRPRNIDAQAYGPEGRQENNEDVYVTFDMPDDTSTHD